MNSSGSQECVHYRLTGVFPVSGLAPPGCTGMSHEQPCHHGIIDWLRLEGAFHTTQSTRPGCSKPGIEHFQGLGCLQLTVHS